MHSCDMNIIRNLRRKTANSPWRIAYGMSKNTLHFVQENYTAEHASIFDSVCGALPGKYDEVIYSIVKPPVSL